MNWFFWDSRLIGLYILLDQSAIHVAESNSAQICFHGKCLQAGFLVKSNSSGTRACLPFNFTSYRRAQRRQLTLAFYLRGPPFPNLPHFLIAVLSPGRRPLHPTSIPILFIKSSHTQRRWTAHFSEINLVPATLRSSSTILHHSFLTPLPLSSNQS